MNAPAWNVVHGRMVREVEETAEQEAARLEREGNKLLQRARDIRHTLQLNALEAVREAQPKPPRCEECDAVQGTVHFGFCSYFGDGAGEVVT